MKKYHITHTLSIVPNLTFLIHRFLLIHSNRKKGTDDLKVLPANVDNCLVCTEPFAFAVVYMEKYIKCIVM